MRAVLLPINLNGDLQDVRLIVLFMAEINLSFTAACLPLLRGCSSRTRAEQFAPRGLPLTCKGLCCAACTSVLHVFQ